jgi:hypothetical protein
MKLTPRSLYDVGSGRTRVTKCAPHRGASWSRFNFSLGTFRTDDRTLPWAASSGFDQPSTIALASSRILELGGRLGEGLPTIRTET